MNDLNTKIEDKKQHHFLISYCVNFGGFNRMQDFYDYIYKSDSKLITQNVINSIKENADKPIDVGVSVSIISINYLGYMSKSEYEA